ncbi:hypothetical protein SAMN05421770_106237 [Granulicella rosea]|uniref:DUF5666 domain-containing protein n=1 Tax=Granulicella rosea TaxID=474952 RepID=A0A239LAJ0_9BACT|nr:hypothetical protein [Granulicella rosea]SNT27295.1 hypothetical protein SAMN05421770_106237 [Granulicella rosea]
MVGRFGLGLALGLVLCGSVVAQTAPPATTDAALVEMAGQAGVIFAGTVISIDRADDLGYVDIRFQVERAVLGVRPGGTYAMREWAGLWRGAPPFHVGQRLLVMLREKSANGLSSPVASGVMPIVGAGAPAAAKVEDAAAAQDAAVDLRWVGTRVAASAAPVPVVPAPVVPVSGVGMKPLALQGPVVSFETASAGPALSSVLNVLQAAVNHGRR